MTFTIYFDAGLKPVIKHQEHDQKTHGSWATGQKGGSGLSAREMYNLKVNRTDPQVRKVYDAQEKHYSQIQNPNLEPPSAPNRADFADYDEYNKAYKKYSKDWLDYSRKSTTAIISPIAEKHLDGTPRGVEAYVNEVVRSDWFVETYGNGGSFGFPKVMSSFDAGAASGAFQIGFKNDVPFSRIKISRGYSKAEPTLIHEIAHYATTISATSPHDAHGVEYRRNHIYIASQVLGADFANGLEKAYREEGLSLGD